MTAPARSRALAVSEAAPRCQDELIVGAETHYALISHVQARAFDRTVPLNVSLELTLNCNIRCLHCYNLDRDLPQGSCQDAAAGGAGRVGERGVPLREPVAGGVGPSQGPTVNDARPDLSFEEIMRLLPELRAAGCLFLTLSGGEVLTYPHLWEVLDRARELNFAVQLLTNGTMLQPGVAGRLAAYRNLLGASVSLYGATPDVHDGVTQMPGSWKRTWDGAERLRAAGIAVRLKFIVMSPNAHQVAEMRAQAADRGFSYLVDVTITPRHDGTRGSLEMRVSDDQLATLYRGPLRDLLPSGTQPVTEERFPCNCARGNCAINVKGDVHPCVSVPWPAGNVREQRFADIWATSPVFEKIRGLRIADYEACAPCPDKPYCSRNRGAAFNYSGRYTGTDPFVCRSAAIARDVVTSPASSRE